MLAGSSLTNICDVPGLELTTEETRVLAGGGLLVAILAYDAEQAKPEAEIDTTRLNSLHHLRRDLALVVEKLPSGDTRPSSVYGVDWKLVCQLANQAWITARYVPPNDRLKAARQALGDITNRIAQDHAPRNAPSIAGKVLIGIGVAAVVSVVVWALVAKRPKQGRMVPKERRPAGRAALRSGRWSVASNGT